MLLDILFESKLSETRNGNVTEWTIGYDAGRFKPVAPKSTPVPKRQKL